MHSSGGPAAALAGHVIRSLREAGHAAYLVGGCVRDLLLDQPVKDFDVATSATPDEVLAIFPAADRIGAHFGVVLVRRAGEGAAVEVATFRSDHTYRDGRHPDGVTYQTDPRQDALRRDFTINAMMMDPVTGAILDFAGGRADLAARLIRAVGNPLERFGEDHLRMLRAIRFAARLGFEVEAETMRAVEALAPKIRSIPAERVREELERIFTEGGARRGLELLDGSGLLGEVLPEVPRPLPAARLASIEAIRAAPAARLTLTLAVLLERIAGDPAAPLERLRFSTAQTRRVQDLLALSPRLAELPGMSVAAQKRLLRSEGFAEHLEFERIRHAAANPAVYELAAGLRARIPREELNPPRLATGDDLILMGVPPGPLFARALERLETAQLEGLVTTREEALALLRREAEPAGQA